MLLRFINFQSYAAHYNMAVDEAISILVRQDKSPTTIRFYGWEKPSVSIGEFQKIEEINLNLCNQLNIPVVRRPTGGKGILHYDDITYSFSAKKEGIFKGSLFRSYEMISKILTKSFELSGLKVEYTKEKRIVSRSSLCFAVSSFGEICYQNCKIVGSAQKRWMNGFLQQGTIPLKVSKKLMLNIFIGSDANFNKIFGIKELFEDFDEKKFIENVKESLRDCGFQIFESCLQREEIQLAEELVEKKYSSPAWLLDRSFEALNSMQKR